MGDVLPFGRRDHFALREPVGGFLGCIHIWMHGPNEFEIGHESSSGNSRGWFEQFSTAADALAAAHSLNVRELGGEAEIYIPDAMRAILRGGGA